MVAYTIAIDGYESGLTEKTVEQTMREQFGGQDVSISVSKRNANITVERREPYLNIFYKGRLMASLSEKHDELLVYECGTQDPLHRESLSELKDGVASYTGPEDEDE